MATRTKSARAQDILMSQLYGTYIELSNLKTRDANFIEIAKTSMRITLH